MTSFFNSNLLPIVQTIISEFKNKGETIFLTIDVLEAQLGRYVVDNCEPKFSFNANYGKFLKENENALGIKEIQKDIPITDKYGSSSTCSKWKII